MADRRAAVGFIVAALAIDALGFGIVVPLVPELVRRLAGTDQSGASPAVGTLVMVFALAQLAASPVLGGLSDRYGRRPVMLLSIAGVAANYLLLAWAPSLAWLYLGRVLAGVTSATVSTASAYIADISTPEERGRRFGLIGASFGVGFILGPVLGGVLGDVAVRLPFVVAAGLAGINLLYGVFVLPESLTAERRQPFTLKGANPVAAVRMLWADPITRRLAVAWSCQWFALGTLQTVFVLSTSLRFGWGGTQNGLALGVVGILSAVMQGFLARRAFAWLGERRAAMGGAIASACASLIFALAPSGAWFFVAISVQGLGALTGPALRSMLSARAGPERQGAMMGALSAVEGLTAIVSPVVAAALFSYFASSHASFILPGAPFLAASAAFVLAWAAIGGKLWGTAVDGPKERAGSAAR
jgi:DHA1 family tetracycline resistance protein-like MFS transporter